MSSDIDKNTLYGDFRNHQEKKNALALKAAHKALDLPQDDMNIRQTTVNKGVSGRGVAVALLAGALALAAGGAGTLGLMRLLTPAPVVPAPSVVSKPEVPAAVKPAPATAYDAIYEEQDLKTGEWKQTRREHLK